MKNTITLNRNQQLNALFKANNFSNFFEFQTQPNNLFNKIVNFFKLLIK